MDMRLEHRSIQPERTCGLCSATVNVEGDVPLPGSLRETTNILYAGASAVVESTEAMQDRVAVSGRVIFRVLYVKGDSTKVETIEAAANFSHICDLPGATAHSDVYACAQAMHVQHSVQGGRVNLRTQVHLDVRAITCEPVDIVTGSSAAGLERKVHQMTLRSKAAGGSREVLLREEFALSAELAIQDTLGASAIAVFHDTAGGQGRIGVAGEVTIEAVHTSGVPGKPLVMTRHTVPVSQSVEIAGEAGDLLDGRIIVKDVAVASQDAGDGERTLRAEVLLGLDAWSEREETVEVLADAYTTSGEDVRLTREMMRVRTGANRVHAAESGKASLLLPDGAPPLRTMLTAFATPVLTGHTQQGNRLITEGLLETTLLYMSGEGNTPVSVRLDAPFRAAFAANAGPEDIVSVAAANVEAQTVTSDRAELRYILHLAVEGQQSQEIQVVTDASAVAGKAPTKDIVLYFTQPGEQLWDIAKRYRLPESDVRRLNPDLQGDPKPGQGIVVWRRSME